MTFTTKSWQDSPSTSTPISAAALIDLETRLSGYTDTSSGGTAAAPTGVSATDTATVLAAIQSGLPLADGNYVCTTAGLNLSAGTKIMMKGQGSGRTTISMPSGAFNAANISVIGSATGSAYSLTAQANLGDNTLTLSSANATALAAVAGDYLHLWSSKLVPATDANGAVQGEIVRVKSVNTGTGVITLYSTVDDTYALADTARLRKLALLSGCYIEGVTLINTTPLTGGSAMMMASWTRGLRIRDVLVVQGDGPGLQINDSVDADVQLMVRDLADDTANNRYGYGVLAWGSTRSSRFDIDAERCRHAFTTGADTLSGFATNPQHCGVPRHIDVSGQARETTDVGWDTHSQGDDIRFYISSVACQGAFQARAPNVKLMRWSFQNCRDASYLFWTATGFRAMPGMSRGTRTGNASVFRIGDTSGNILTDVKFYGLHSDSDGHVAILQNCTDVVFSEPVITNPTAGAAFVNSGGISNVKIVLATTDNVPTLISGGTTGITVFSPPGNTPVNVTAPPYNALGDLKTVTDAAITTGTNILTSATAAFAATDVGKSVNVAGAGAAGVYLVTTIAGYTNATTVTTTANASTTVSAATMSFGTNNRAAIVAAIAAGATQFYFPTGNFYVDTSGGSLALSDGATVIGDGWSSIVTYGPEGATSSVNLFASVGNNVRFERIRLVGPQTLGAGGVAIAISMSGTNGRATLRDVNLRLFSSGVLCSANGGVVDIQNCEIEGRITGGGATCTGMNHSGTSGELRADDVYVWNFGLGNASGIIATTGVNLSVTRCKFDAQAAATTGVVVDHFDALGSAPTANLFSRIIGNEFGTALTGTSVRTPYQGSCQVKDNDFNAPVRSLLITATALVDGNRFLSAAATAGFHMIDMGGVTTPITSTPAVQFTANRFEGIAQYAIYSNAAGDADILDNDILIGNGTTPAAGEVRFDASVTSGSRINIKHNRFAGQTSSNFCIKISQGIVAIIGNAFSGTYSGGCVASESGTPAALRVRGNQFDQASQPVVLTTSPTVLDVQGNFGSHADAGYRSTNASLTVQATHDQIGVTSTAAARTITLLAITASSKGKIITVVDESNAAATNNITVACAGADTFLGAATTKVINTNGGTIRFYTNGTNWIQV